jgi:aspartyl-tRNA(Asn)/glutamyl-tRNA(Gln) amidotransferase subunit A
VRRADEGLDGLRLGVPTAWLERGVDPEVRAAFDRALDTLRDLGAAVEEVTLPPADVMTFVNRIITLGEAGAYHADLLAHHGDDYAPDVRARLELAQFILTRDYLTGQRLRGELSRAMAAVMTNFDALLTPTMPIPAPRIGQNLWTYADGTSEPVQEAMIRYTAPFSVSGQPALSVPCGFTASGLPIGLQIVGRPFEEATVLRIGAAFEAAAEIKARRPELG